MLTQEYIDKLLAWEEEQNGREITITIKRDYRMERTISIRCWDSTLMSGDYFEPPAMPDIPEAIKRRELAELEKLQAKYGKAA